MYGFIFYYYYSLSLLHFFPFLFHAVLPLSVQTLIHGICTTMYSTKLTGGAVETTGLCVIQVFGVPKKGWDRAN